MDHLVVAGDSVVVVDNFSMGNYRNPSAKYLRIDVRDGRKISQAIKSTRPNVVVGAWTVRLLQCVEDPLLSNSVNCLGALNILEAVRRTDSKFIYLSTGSVYGHGSVGLNREDGPTSPNTIYGASKLAAESYVGAYVDTYGIESVILRLHSVFGPRQDSSRYGGVVSIFIHKALRNRPLTIYGSGKQTRPFLFVQDAVRAILLSDRKGALGHTINIAGRRSYAINYLARLTLKYLGSNRKSIHIDIGNRPHVKHFHPSILKVRQTLLFSPQIDFRDGLRLTINQMRQQYREGRK